jgi:putative ABC transport system substrate-binding protein
MRRRRFITLLGGTALTFPFASRAKAAPNIPVVGVLSPFPSSTAAPWHKAFTDGLRELGWNDGQNIRIEFRYAESGVARLPEIAADLVRQRCNVIVTSVNTDTLAMKNATRTIPIVMASAGDPVGGGLVKSLARPGGNITGLSQIAPDLAGKRLQVLKELVPSLASVGVIWNPKGTTSPIAWKEIQLPAQQLLIKLQSLPVTGANGFENAFHEANAAHADALVIMPDPLFAGSLKRLAELAAKYRLPSTFHLKEYADYGGLVAYGVDRTDQFHRAASFVDKILKGAKPADLPVEQPTKFELVINLRTAKVLGIPVPPSLLARADDVIE